MNYPNSMSLLPSRSGPTVIVDTHEIFSVGRHLSSRARALLADGKYEFSRPETELEHFMCDRTEEISQEIAALNKADLILAISKKDGQFFQDHSTRKVFVLNYSAGAPEISAPARCNSLGVMPIGTGENPHNILGAYCLDRAMRRSNVRGSVVAAFGGASREIRLGSWCKPAGYVADYFEASACVPPFGVRALRLSNMNLRRLAYQWWRTVGWWILTSGLIVKIAFWWTILLHLQNACARHRRHDFLLTCAAERAC